MTHASAITTLKTASGICIAFGLAMVLAVMSPLSAVLNVFLDLAHLPLDGAQALTSGTDRLLLAISGGLLVGLGAFTWQIAEHVYRPNPALGGRILIIGLLAWFIPDSTGSVASGAWFNVVLNSGFLALYMVPVLLARHAPLSEQSA